MQSAFAGTTRYSTFTAGMVVLFCSFPAAAESRWEIRYEGRLSLHPQTTLNFFSVEEGGIAGGVLVYAPEKPPRDKSAKPENINFNRGALPWAQLQLYQPEVIGSRFIFRQDIPEGLQDDRLRLEPLGENQNLYFQESFSENKEPCILGNGGHCWRLQISLVMPPQSLPVEWPQPVSLSEGDWINGLVRFSLNDPTLGFMRGEITLETVTVQRISAP